MRLQRGPGEKPSWRSYWRRRQTWRTLWPSSKLLRQRKSRKRGAGSDAEPLRDVRVRPHWVLGGGRVATPLFPVTDNVGRAKKKKNLGCYRTDPEVSKKTACRALSFTLLPEIRFLSHGCLVESDESVACQKLSCSILCKRLQQHDFTVCQ